MFRRSFDENIAYFGNEVNVYSSSSVLFSSEDEIERSKRPDPLVRNCRCCFYCMPNFGYDITDQPLNLPQTINNWIMRPISTSYKQAIVTLDGTMLFLLTENIEVEMSLDKAILIKHVKERIYLGINNDTSVASLYHPMGYVTYKTDYTQVMIYDKGKGNKLFKLRSDSIEFVTSNRKSTFRLNHIGLNSTTMRKLVFMCSDPEEVFYCGCIHGPNLIETCTQFIDAGHLSSSSECISWIINKVKIKLETSKSVRVYRDYGKVQFRMVENGSCCFKKPGFYCCASMGLRNHLFVRAGPCQLYYNGENVTIKYYNKKIVCKQNDVVSQQ